MPLYGPGESPAYRRLPLEKLAVASMVAAGYHQREIAERTSYAESTIKNIVAELAELAGNSGGGMAAVRDWWRADAVSIAADVLALLDVPPEAVAAELRRRAEKGERS